MASATTHTDAKESLWSATNFFGRDPASQDDTEELNSLQRRGEYMQRKVSSNSHTQNISDQGAMKQSRGAKRVPPGFNSVVFKTFLEATIGDQTSPESSPLQFQGCTVLTKCAGPGAFSGISKT